MSRGKGRRGSLFGLLARYVLLFTLALFALAALALYLWDARMAQLFSPPDWDGLLSDPALRAGRYEELVPYLQNAGEFAVYEEGALVYATAEDFDPLLTEGELSCIPLQGETIQADTYPQPGAADGEQLLIVRQNLDAEGNIDAQAVVLDADGQVLWGGFGDGRAAYTARELSFLTNSRFEGCFLTRAPLPGAPECWLLLRERVLSEGEYLRRYADAQRVLVPFVPLLFGAAALSVWLLWRRIAKPLRRLDDAVAAQAAGHPARAGGCGGPREVRRIAESFDRFADQLEASEAERNRLDAARQKMIADISHDIKTPVTVICGGIDAVCDGKVPPEDFERTLRMIRQRADTLARLADDFHEYAKVEHPAFALHAERTDACEFLREYLAAKYDEIELAGFTLEASIPEQPIRCCIDGFQLTRALDNLLSNALRHNRLGTALFFAVGAADGCAVIRIADNGEGIPPERRARIFEPFVTGDDARSSAGSGLGLSIALQIVKAHGGTLSLEPHPLPPRVTEFVLSLPLSEM